MNKIELIGLKEFPLIEPEDNLGEIIINSISSNNISINNNDIIVVAQKIISKSENRYINLDTIDVSEKARKLSLKLNKDEGLVQAIINESNRIISAKKK